MTALSLAKPGMHYTVKWNLETAPGTRQAAAWGLGSGDRFYLVASYFGNVIVRTTLKQFALGRDVAERITV